MLNKTKFGINVCKQPNEMWSFSVGVSKCFKEIYLYIEFWKFEVSIGKIVKMEKGGAE